MLKFELDESTLRDLEEELHKGLNNSLNATIAAVAGGVQAEAVKIASSKLKRGLTFWERGFSVDKIGEGEWLISLSGKLATMMEDGFGTGEIKRMLLNGNRAKTNSENGAKYVDVPIGLNADSITGKIGKSEITVNRFKNADELMHSIRTSDWKRGGIKRERVISSRIADIIKTRKENQKKAEASFITIRRVSEKSKGWPANPFSGAHVLDKLDDYLERAFEENLERLI